MLLFWKRTQGRADPNRFLHSYRVSVDRNPKTARANICGCAEEIHTDEEMGWLESGEGFSDRPTACDLSIKPCTGMMIVFRFLPILIKKSSRHNRLHKYHLFFIGINITITIQRVLKGCFLTVGRASLWSKSSPLQGIQTLFPCLSSSSNFLPWSAFQNVSRK